MSSPAQADVVEVVEVDMPEKERAQVRKRMQWREEVMVGVGQRKLTCQHHPRALVRSAPSEF